MSRPARGTFNLSDSPPMTRLRYTILLFVLVVLVGVYGYHRLAGTDVLDSFYMAVTTLFTVGFRELGSVTPYTKVFTIVYLVAGLGIATYALSNLTALIVEGDLQGYLQERRMEKRLLDLKDHVIICGFGKMGFQAAWELKKAGVPFVIVEADESKGRSPRFAGDIILYGNAMDEMVLERAGIRRARGLITALTTDADNVLVTLTVKQIRADLPVVARSAKLGTEKQLKAAGADHIVSPYEIGGRRMAYLLLTPDLMNYVDVLVDGNHVELALEHILVAPASELVGKSLRQVRMRETTGTLVVGVNRDGEGLHFNPTGGETFQVGDVILAMGTHESLGKLVQLARGDS